MNHLTSDERLSVCSCASMTHFCQMFAYYKHARNRVYVVSNHIPLKLTLLTCQLCGLWLNVESLYCGSNRKALLISNKAHAHKCFFLCLPQVNSEEREPRKQHRGAGVRMSNASILTRLLMHTYYSRILYQTQNIYYAISTDTKSLMSTIYVSLSLKQSRRQWFAMQLNHCNS